MKNTIFDNSDYETILRRINNLEIDSNIQFEKLGINEMLCHIADQIRLALGYLELKNTGNFFDRTLIKWFELSMREISAEKINRVEGVIPEIEKTKPVNFIDDKVTLVKLLEQLVRKDEAYDWGEHPKFGQLNRKEWGKLIYAELNYYLKQFGN